MESSSNTATWHSVLADSFEQALSYTLAYLPQLLGALCFLIGGWLVATLLSKTLLTLVGLLNRLISRISPAIIREKRSELKPSQQRLLSKVVFWLVMLFFIAAAANTLGLDFFAATLASVIAYLPRLLAGILIILAGFLVGGIAQGMARPALDSAGLKNSEATASVIRLAVIFTTLVIGVEQIGIKIHFITNIVVVLLGVLSAGIALAFGLGCRDLLANIAGARQARKHVKIRDHISINGKQGVLIDFTATMLILENDAGRTLLPAKEFLSSAVLIQSDQENDEQND